MAEAQRLRPPSCLTGKVPGLEGKSSNESNMDLNRDEKLCMEQNAEFKYYTSAQCPKYYALDETCDIDTHYLDCNPVRWCFGERL